jgi:hypothetical protein
VVGAGVFTGNLDQLFRQTYPGYGYNASAFYTQYHHWSQTSLDTMLGTLRARSAGVACGSK